MTDRPERTDEGKSHIKCSWRVCHRNSWKQISIAGIGTHQGKCAYEGMGNPIKELFLDLRVFFPDLFAVHRSAVVGTERDQF
ncbi:MAG: hypothetical protein PHF57_03725, partial [Methanoregula sp.]|nr:hypothetical protein [Methanoregula sp.]